MSRSYQPEGIEGFKGGTIERVMVALLVSEPAVPVTVMENSPALAVLLAVRVSVLVLLVLAGLNDAVTPLGRPEADKLTLLLNPPCGVTVMVLVPLAASEIVRLLGEVDNAKVPTGFTVRETMVVLTKAPEVPVMVTLLVPTGTVLLTANVNVLVFAVLVGLNVAVTPFGNPEADKLTLLLKPFRGTTAIVLVPLLPCVTLTLVGDAESAKLAGGN